MKKLLDWIFLTAQLKYTAACDYLATTLVLLTWRQYPMLGSAVDPPITEVLLLVTT